MFWSFDRIVTDIRMDAEWVFFIIAVVIVCITVTCCIWCFGAGEVIQEEPQYRKWKLKAAVSEFPPGGAYVNMGESEYSRASESGVSEI